MSNGQPIIRSDSLIAQFMSAYGLQSLVGPSGPWNAPTQMTGPGGVPLWVAALGPLSVAKWLSATGLPQPLAVPNLGGGSQAVAVSSGISGGVAGVATPGESSSDAGGGLPGTSGGVGATPPPPPMTSDQVLAMLGVNVDGLPALVAPDTQFGQPNAAVEQGRRGPIGTASPQSSAMSADATWHGPRQGDLSIGALFTSSISQLLSVIGQGSTTSLDYGTGDTGVIRRDCVPAIIQALREAQDQIDKSGRSNEEKARDSSRMGAVAAQGMSTLSGSGPFSNEEYDFLCDRIVAMIWREAGGWSPGGDPTPGDVTVVSGDAGDGYAFTIERSEDLIISFPIPCAVVQNNVTATYEYLGVGGSGQANVGITSPDQAPRVTRSNGKLGVTYRLGIPSGLGVGYVKVKFHVICKEKGYPDLERHFEVTRAFIVVAR